MSEVSLAQKIYAKLGSPEVYQRQYVELTTKNSQRLLGVLGTDSIFLPFNMPSRSAVDPEIAMMIQTNLAALSLAQGQSWYPKAFSVLGLNSNSSNGGIFSDAQNIGEITGIHLHGSLGHKNQAEFLNDFAAMAKSKNLEYSVTQSL